MSELYLNDRIFEIQKKLSIKEVRIVRTEIMNYYKGSKRFSIDEEFKFWQLYYQKKIQNRIYHVLVYIYLSIIVLITSLSNPFFKEYFKENFETLFSLWLLFPALLYYLFIITMKHPNKTVSNTTHAILEAFFWKN